MNLFKSATEREYEDIVRSREPVLSRHEIRNLTVKAPATLDDLVASQDRTTHAVRSLAISFVAAPIITFVVLLAVFLAARFGNSFAIVIVGLTAIAILIGTLLVAIKELAESKVKN